MISQAQADAIARVLENEWETNPAFRERVLAMAGEAADRQPEPEEGICVRKYAISGSPGVDFTRDRASSLPPAPAAFLPPSAAGAAPQGARR